MVQQDEAWVLNNVGLLTDWPDPGLVRGLTNRLFTTIQQTDVDIVYKAERKHKDTDNNICQGINNRPNLSVPDATSPGPISWPQRTKDATVQQITTQDVRLINYKQDTTNQLWQRRRPTTITSTHHGTWRVQLKTNFTDVRSATSGRKLLSRHTIQTR